jgi:hypothetical protein
MQLEMTSARDRLSDPDSLAQLDGTLERAERDLQRRTSHLETVSQIADTLQAMCRDAGLAKRLMVQISESERSIRDKSIQVDLILGAEMEEKALQISAALGRMENFEEISARIADIPDIDITTPVIDIQEFRDTLSRGKSAVQSEKTSRKDKGSTSHRRIEEQAGPTRYRGQWDKPPKHPKFGNAMSASEVEKATEQFFSRLWREGVLQKHATTIMFSRTSHSEGLTVHDALAYARGVDAMNRSVIELKVKYSH